jgi:hypothetical protein
MSEQKQNRLYLLSFGLVEATGDGGWGPLHVDLGLHRALYDALYETGSFILQIVRQVDHAKANDVLRITTHGPMPRFSLFDEHMERMGARLLSVEPLREVGNDSAPHFLAHYTLEMPDA